MKACRWNRTRTPGSISTASSSKTSVLRSSRCLGMDSSRTKGDVEAGAAIPAVWQSPPSTAEDLGSLVAASIANRDARILDAVMTVATNAGAAPELRIASLRVLASYGDRRVWVSLEDLQSRRALILPFTDHPIGREGNNPLPVDIRARVLAVLNGLAQGDPNDSIRDAARFLVKAFPLP